MTRGVDVDVTRGVDVDVMRGVNVDVTRGVEVTARRGSVAARREGMLNVIEGKSRGTYDVVQQFDVKTPVVHKYG